MTEELDEFLKGDESEDQEAEDTQTETETEETKGEEEETEQETETDSKKDAETPAAQEDQDQSWTKAMALDERRKRQALERELEELRSKSTKGEEEESPDVLDDPKGYTESIKTEMGNMLVQERINLSREMMMDRYDDYDEMEMIFTDLAKDDPTLGRQLSSHPNPAKFAYETAKKHQQYQEMQDVDSYKAKLEAEVRAKLEKEFEEKAQKRAEKAESITPSLAKARSADAEQEVLEESVEDILGR